MPPAKILIVDDEIRMLESLSVLMSGQGYRVETASSGSEALDKLAVRDFDVILLDMLLDDMDGYQVMERVRAFSPDALVVIMTGNASVESAVKALKLGAYSYLKKPFEVEDLFKTIENALSQKRSESERKLAVAALRESEERFRALVENSLIGIFIIQNGRIVYQNPLQVELFGNLAAVRITDLPRCVVAEDVPTIMAAYQRLDTGRAETVQADFRLKAQNGGNVRWVQCRANSFVFKGEKAILVNMMDVTRARELEQLVLFKNKMHSLGRIAAGMAHEIRNPLAGINSYLYTLKDLCALGELDDDQLATAGSIVGQIQAASDRIETVIKRVMDFAKPNQPRMLTVDVNEPVEKALDLAATTLRKSGISLVKRLAAGLPRIQIDPHLIAQAVMNLVDNAARTLQRHVGSRTIEVSTGVGRGGVFIIVSDTGPGVSADVRPYIFDPFFTTRSDGSGIGLSIVQRIVTDHRGSIEVGSTDAGGAKFRIELPFSGEKAEQS